MRGHFLLIFGLTCVQAWASAWSATPRSTFAFSTQFSYLGNTTLDFCWSLLAEIFRGRFSVFLVLSSKALVWILVCLFGCATNSADLHGGHALDRLISMAAVGAVARHLWWRLSCHSLRGAAPPHHVSPHVHLVSHGDSMPSKQGANVTDQA